MKPILLGLAGPMNCGKSTVADHLVREHGFTGPLHFADPMKDAICAMMSIDRAELERLKRTNDPVFAGRTMRHALQTLGTEWGRDNISPDVWVKLLARHVAHIEQWETVPAGIVIADVRFENETSWIRAQGGIVIHIQRAASRIRPPRDSHVSEWLPAIHEDDFTLPNNGSLQDLYRCTDNLLARIRGFSSSPSYIGLRSA